jgi:hypothetical protein
MNAQTDHLTIRVNVIIDSVPQWTWPGFAGQIGLTMSTITILPVEGTELYCHYAKQTQRQPCYVQLDCQTGVLSASYNVEIGSGSPARVFNGLAVRWTIPALKADAANDLLAEIKPLAERVVAGFFSEWSGGNEVGRFNADAGAACDEIRLLCDRMGGERVEMNVWDAVSYFAPLGNDLECAQTLGIQRNTSDTELKAIAEREVATAASNDIDLIDGLAEYLEKLRDKVRWAPCAMLAGLYEEIGWTWVQPEKLPMSLASVVDDALDESMRRGSKAWTRAHGHLMQAAEACERLDRETALRELRAADEIADRAEAA